MDFTNPFLDYDQGYVRPFATILPTVKATLIPIPSEDESVLPKKPLTRKETKTRRGYPRGESQGESLGKILLPSLLIRVLKNLLQGCLSSRGRRGISLLRKRGWSGINVCSFTATTRVVSRRGGTTGENPICHAPGIFHLSFYLLSTSSRLTQDIPREKTKQPLLLEAREEIQRLQADYRTTRRCSHPNPTRRYRQNPWAHRPSSPTPPYDSLEGLDPSSPERRGDEEPHLANTLGRQREPGRWDGTRSPMAQQRA